MSRGRGEVVDCQHVEPAVANERRNPSHRVEQACHARSELLTCRLETAPPCRAGLARGPGQVEQVLAFCLVELQRAGDGLQDDVRGAGDVSAFQPGVVLDADPGQLRDLGAAQSAHPALAVGGQGSLFRGDLCSAGGEELPHLVPVVHAVEATRQCFRAGSPCQYPSGQGLPLPRPNGLSGQRGTDEGNHVRWTRLRYPPLERPPAGGCRG